MGGFLRLPAASAGRCPLQLSQVKMLGLQITKLAALNGNLSATASDAFGADNGDLPAGLKWLLGCLSTLGLAGNALVAATLMRRRYPRSKFASSLMLHQTLLDLAVSAFTLALLLKPDQNPSNSYAFGLVLCHIVSSQFFYWCTVFSSVQNLLLIAADRYWAVCRPVDYKLLGARQATVCIGVLHGYSLLVNIVDVFSVTYKSAENLCTGEIGPTWKTVFKVYGFVWLALVYLAPAVVLICLYSRIVCRLSRRVSAAAAAASNGTSGGGGNAAAATAAGRSRPRLFRRAASELTKSAAVIACIFVASFGYDCLHYLLGHLDLLHYVYNSPAQLIGVCLVTVNSCANPIVYCAIMRSFRSRLADSLSCCRLSCDAAEESRNANVDADRDGDGEDGDDAGNDDANRCNNAPDEAVEVEGCDLQLLEPHLRTEDNE